MVCNFKKWISVAVFLFLLNFVPFGALAQQSVSVPDDAEVSQALIAVGCFDGDVESMSLFKKRNAVRCFQDKLGDNADGNLTQRQAVLVLEASQANGGYAPNTCTRFFEDEGFFRKDFTGRRALLEQVKFDESWNGACLMFREIRRRDTPDLFSREDAVVAILDSRRGRSQSVQRNLSKVNTNMDEPFASLLFALLFPEHSESVSNAERAAAGGYLEAKDLIIVAKTAQGFANAIETCDELASDPFDDNKGDGRTGQSIDSLSRDAASAIAACEQASVAEPDEQRFVYQYARALAANGDGTLAIEALDTLDLNRYGGGAYLKSTLVDGRQEKLSLLTLAVRGGYVPASSALVRLGGDPKTIGTEMLLAQVEGVAYLNETDVEFASAEFDYDACVRNRMGSQGFYSTTPPSNAQRRTDFTFARNFATGECRKDQRKFNEKNNPRCYDITGQLPLPSRLRREAEPVQQLVLRIKTDGDSLGMFGARVMEERLGQVTDWAAYRFAVKNNLSTSYDVFFDEDLQVSPSSTDPRVIEAIETVKAEVSPIFVVLSFSKGPICGL